MNEKPKILGAIGWILLLGAILTIAVFLSTPRVEWPCSSLLEQRDAPMFLPTDCTLMERAHIGDALGRFEAERSKRGLSHQSRIEWRVTSGRAGLGEGDGGGSPMACKLRTGHMIPMAQVSLYWVAVPETW